MCVCGSVLYWYVFLGALDYCCIFRETIARVTGGMKVKADRDEVCVQDYNTNSSLYYTIIIVITLLYY